MQTPYGKERILMNRYILWVSVFLAWVTAIPCSAQSRAALHVEQFSFCRIVENRAPVGTDSIFPDTVGRVFCFTKVSGAAEPAMISHVWYFNEKQISRIDLEVKSKTWRTWSYKKIPKGWIGTWRVDLVSSDGEVLQKAQFTVIEAPE